MSSKSLFSNKSKSSKSSVSAKVTKVPNVVNKAGGPAYSLSDKAALAQLAMTGCFNGTFYVSAQDQLKQTLDLANKLDPVFVAKLAVYARQKGLMKDMPAVLAAVVAGKDSDLLAKIFSKVVDNPKMLRNFVQVMRSGATGRKSLGTRPKKLVQDYLNSLNDDQLFKADVGNDPSLQDIIKLVHPKPNNKQRSALYGYLLGKDYNKRDLCALAKEYENFKKEMKGEIPDVPFQMLTALPLTSAHWKQIAENATWTQTRMNLNTFERHGVFADSGLTNTIVDRLQNAEQIKKAKVFPYQLFTAFKNADVKVPVKVTNALQKAAEVAVENVPAFEGKTYVLMDVSGSTHDPVTGHRGTATSKVRCIDVEALVSAAVLRKNPDAEVIAFSDDVVLKDRNGAPVRLNPHDSIMTNAEKLAHLPSGGTNCSAPLAWLNRQNAKGDLVIYVSDNQSWVDAGRSSYGRGTATMQEWNKFKARNPNAKLVCIDITPYANTQAHDREDVLNVGGFSDQVFDVIARFIELGNNKDLWVQTIESVKL
jgi:60 kDa SS-A/Ro ribonucleoprotein